MPEFKPPRVNRGDIVMWYQAGVSTSEPYVAIVTSIGVGSMVSLRVFPDGLERVPFVSGSRYLGDQSSKEGELRMSGAWEPMEEYEDRQDRIYNESVKRQTSEAAKAQEAARKKSDLQPA